MTPTMLACILIGVPIIGLLLLIGWLDEKSGYNFINLIYLIGWFLILGSFATAGIGGDSWSGVGLIVLVVAFLSRILLESH